MIHTPANEFPVPGDAYLSSTEFLDCDNPRLRDAVAEVTSGIASDTEKAIHLFYWVRDNWRYNPFSIDVTKEAHIASRLLDQQDGYCMTKAILLVAAARAANIPCALGMSDVTNHLTSNKLKEFMGGNTTFVNHGYALLYLNGKWVKAAPAFNTELCERFGVRPTEFDGQSDAVLQEFDVNDRRHMEYINDRGFWSDFPYDSWLVTMSENYPLEIWQGYRKIQDFSPE